MRARRLEQLRSADAGNELAANSNGGRIWPEVVQEPWQVHKHIKMSRRYSLNPPLSIDHSDSSYSFSISIPMFHLEPGLGQNLDNMETIEKHWANMDAYPLVSIDGILVWEQGSGVRITMARPFTADVGRRGEVMTARIFQPSKTAMQSGKGGTKAWVLEHEPAASRQIDPLMGWTSASDMGQQVRLSFATKEEAIAYAERNGIGQGGLIPNDTFFEAQWHHVNTGQSGGTPGADIETDAAWEIGNHAMQIMGGIGYTNVYPIERLLRDLRLCMIWTGTNEIMNLIIQHEYYQEMLQPKPGLRDVEADAEAADAIEEKEC